MSNVPPDQPPTGGGWQQPSGGSQPNAGWQQQQPPPPPPPQQPPGGYGQPQHGGYQQRQQPVGPGGQPLAEWWKRFVAIIIDGLILGVPLVIIFFVFAGISFTQTTEVDPVTGEITRGGGLFTGSTLLFQVVSIIAAVAYYGLLNGSDRGQTVGKMALNIRVRDADAGGPIGVGRGVVRGLVAVVPAQLPLVGFIWALVDGLWPLWDQRRQALHDKAANSVVVDAT